MVTNFKQLVPQEICLSCDGCCRFKEPDSLWRPKVFVGEIAQAVKRGLAEEIFLKESLDQGNRVKAVSCQGGHFCRFLDVQTNKCTAYGFRPFECRLYPFVLVKNTDRVSVCVHHHCPFVQEKRNSSEFIRYVSYLKRLFKGKNMRRFIQENLALVDVYQDYRGELENLFIIE